MYVLYYTTILYYTVLYLCIEALLQTETWPSDVDDMTEWESGEWDVLTVAALVIHGEDFNDVLVFLLNKACFIRRLKLKGVGGEGGGGSDSI